MELSTMEQDGINCAGTVLDEGTIKGILEAEGSEGDDAQACICMALVVGMVVVVVVVGIFLLFFLLFFVCMKPASLKCPLRASTSF